MRIILDAMGGDNAPLEIIKGALAALENYDTDITLVGNLEQIKQCAEQNWLNIDNPRLTLVNAEETITMEDSALAVRSKKNSSMAVALSLLKEGEGDAFVSAGNTGALYAGASLIVGRIKGYRKAAIATVMPFENPTLLVDSGANTVVTDENLEQFAIMGSIYMNKIFDMENPRVGLLNNGTESTKGTQIMQDTFQRLTELSEAGTINFVGNVEGKQLPMGVCDVIVTDGFTGNIVLKFTEGLGSFLLGKLKGIFFKNILTKLSAAMLKKDLAQFKKEFDPSEYGGAPILGIAKPVIKSHGSSDAREIQNAVRQAINYEKTGLIYDIAKLSKKPAVKNPSEEKTVAEPENTAENDNNETQEESTSSQS